MRVLWFLIKVLGFLVLLPIALPFLLIDWLFIDLPKSILDNRWRKNVKIGDTAYFINLLDSRTYGEITSLPNKDGEVGFKTSNSRGPHKLSHLYPVKGDMK